jgi:hypothetical protein
MPITKLRFPNAADAIYRSAQEAELRGCDMIFTTLWWGLSKDEIGYYLEISDTDGLTDDEINNLENEA